MNASGNNAMLTRYSLAAGIMAGPILIIVALAQAFTREGYDTVKHPMSLLSNGDLGWIQVANFIVASLLYFVCAWGLNRALVSGVGHKWGAWLFALFALGLFGGGVFAADPALGFPPGTPDGIPPVSEWTTAGTLHAFTPLATFIGLTAFLFVIAKRFFRMQLRSWGKATLAGSFVVLLFSLPLNFATGPNVNLPLWLGLILGFMFTSFVLARLREEVSDQAG